MGFRRDPRLQPRPHRAPILRGIRPGPDGELAPYVGWSEGAGATRPSYTNPMAALCWGLEPSP
jgi:hypothetical protein